jgi:hypothetical protein
VPINSARAALMFMFSACLFPLDQATGPKKTARFFRRWTGSISIIIIVSRPGLARFALGDERCRTRR